MLIQRNLSYKEMIKSYTIEGVSKADMYKMTKVYDKVMKVIGNHLDKEAKKKEYLSDDDLYDIVAILDVLTEGNKTCIEMSCFDGRKEKLIKMHEELVNAPVETPSAYNPDDDE